MAVAPKDGHLYGYDLATNNRLYRMPVSTIENVEGTFAVGQNVHFCPGSVGGSEWNTPGYDPTTNLIITGTRRLVRYRDHQDRRGTAVGGRGAALERNGDVEPDQHVRQARPHRRALGRLDLCQRRRHRGLEMARQVQLSPSRRRRAESCSSAISAAISTRWILHRRRNAGVRVRLCFDQRLARSVGPFSVPRHGRRGLARPCRVAFPSGPSSDP
jgi:hypothetical protein